MSTKLFGPRIALLTTALLLLALVGVAPATSAELAVSDTAGSHNVCVTDPEDITVSSGTCGDEDAWVQAHGERSGLKYCVNSRWGGGDGNPFTCQDNFDDDDGEQNSFFYVKQP